MNKKAFIIILSLLLLSELLALIETSAAAEIADISFRLANNELYASASLKPDRKIVDDLNEGLSKELTFYIDLFRVWHIWPDEFVLGQKIIFTLRSNPIKREYIATRVSGNISLEKRFSDPESMANWATSVADLKLTNTRELEPGIYYLKVTVESRIRKLPPVIGYLLFFMPDKEFSISRDSQTFEINTRNNQP